MPDLFPSSPRRPRRVLMHVVDAGDCESTYRVHLVCPKCGHDDGWHHGLTFTETKRQPCPKCNGGEHA